MATLYLHSTQLVFEKHCPWVQLRNGTGHAQDLTAVVYVAGLAKRTKTKQQSKRPVVKTRTVTLPEQSFHYCCTGFPHIAPMLCDTEHHAEFDGKEHDFCCHIVFCY